MTAFSTTIHMKFIYTFGSIISCLILSNCTQKQEDNKNITLKNEIKENCKTLKATSIELSQEFIYAKSFSVYDDSILIILNKRIEDVYLIEFHNLNDKKELKKIFKYGNGPEEILSAKININQNQLIVDDYIKKEISFINIDSITNNTNYKPTIEKYNIDARSVISYPNNKLLIDNPSYFIDQNFDIKNQTSRFIVSDRDKAKDIQVEKQKYYTRNVSSGKIIANFPSNRIYYINSHLPEIEIYDNSLNLIKRLLGPDLLKVNYTITDNEIIFKKAIPFSYLEYCCNDDYLYTLYMGNFLTEEKRLQDNNLWIFKFDWNGNLIESYSVPQYIENISISTDKDSFYATGYDSEENPILIKLTQL